MPVDPQHSYSNESERANEDIYDGFKCKKMLVSLVYAKVFQRFNIKKSVILFWLLNMTI